VTDPKEIAKAFEEREVSLPGLKQYLKDKFESDSIRDLLTELGNGGFTLTASRDEGSLWVSPRDRLTPEQVELIKLHKHQIIEACHDWEYVKTGKFQCDRHVFEFAREYWELADAR
jgi:hypothetical protein